jgi:polysaccharide biosynthesis transport protein
MTTDEPLAPDNLLILTLRTFRERWWVVMLSVVVCTSGAVLLAVTSTKEYSSTSTLLFRNNQLGDAIGGTQIFSPSVDPDRDLTTDLTLVTSTNVVTAVKKALKSNLTISEIESEVSVRAANGADIGSIVVTDPNPFRAAAIANAFATQYVLIRQKTDRGVIAKAEALIRQRIKSLPTGDVADRVALNAALTKLIALEAVQTGDAEVANAAGVPSSPSSPKPKRDALIGLLIGLLAGAGMAYVLNLLDRHIKQTDDLERLYQLPLLASIPQRTFTTRGPDLEQEQFEPYRILHANLETLLGQTANYLVVVTSAISMEGKSTVAANLARVIAFAGHNVILVEADLRHSSMVEHFDLGTTNVGLTSALTSETELKDLLHATAESNGRLEVLRAGRPVAQPTELLRTQRMRNIMDEARQRAAVVIIDSPPLLPVADTQVLIDRLDPDAVLIVARANHTEASHISRVRSILEQRHIKHVGLVATGVRISRADRESYYYTPIMATENTVVAGRITDSYGKKAESTRRTRDD